jgi:flagellar hook protein FlgE
MPNFSIALTGLQADSTTLNTIGNNLANLNTNAFKEQSTSFEDLFYQNIGNSGAQDPLQLGVGTKVSGTETQFSQGSIATTSNSTDMALNGNGFFVIQNGNVQSLTRAGNFQLDTHGNLITVDGQSVMGFPAINGVVGNSGVLAALQLPVGTAEPALATTDLGLTVNLDSSATTGSTYSTTATVYDSLGQGHVATVTYTKNSTTQWGYAVTLPAADFGTGGTSTTNTGTLTFNSSGVLTSPTATAAAAVNATFTGLADGASTLAFNLNLYDSSGNPTVSQSAAPNNVTASTQNGYTSGVYQSFSVDGTGLITATFSNGHTTNVGQVAVASVANVEGLTHAGSNNYVTTAGSGTATIGLASVGGRAAIDDNALEQSNVDISTEFSNLIVAQRAFEANSKTITTFDTVTQDAIAMLR